MPPKATTTPSSSPLSLLFLAEAIVNTLCALPLLLTPRMVLSYLTVQRSASIAHPASLSTPPIALQLMQIIGSLVLTLSVPLLFGIGDPKGTTAVSSSTSPSAPKPSSPSALLAAARAHGVYRRRVYIMLAAAEVVLSLVIIGHLVFEKSPAGTPGALKPGFLLAMLMILMNCAALRGWAIVCRSWWFGGFGTPLPASGSPKKDM